MGRVTFEEGQLVIKDIFKLFFGKKTIIPYEKIERIESPPGEYVFFYMKNGKVIKVNDPGITVFYTGFGEMLKKYKIPYKCISEGEEYVSVETVREKATRTKELALTCANRSLKEKLGPEYELDAKIVERVIGTTLEFHLLKNGIVQEEADRDESMDHEPVVAEMDIAILCEWDPVREQGKYVFTEEADDKSACEEFVNHEVLDNVYGM